MRGNVLLGWVVNRGNADRLFDRKYSFTFNAQGDFQDFQDFLQYIRMFLLGGVKDMFSKEKLVYSIRCYYGPIFTIDMSLLTQSFR